MLGGIEEESTRAPVNSQWLIAHTYKRRPSHRYIYPWRFHVGKKSFFLGSSNAQGTGFHVSSPSSPTPLASPRRANPLLPPSSTASILLLSTTTPGLEQFYEFLMRRGLQHRGETTRNFLSRALSRIRPSFLRNRWISPPSSTLCFFVSFVVPTRIPRNKIRIKLDVFG